MTKEASYTPDAQIEWLKSHIAKLQLPPLKHDHDTREKFLLDCGMPPEDPKRAAAPEMFEALEAILSEETRSIHVGYDDGPGGGFYVYADAVRVDSPSFDLARAALAKAKGE